MGENESDVNLLITGIFFNFFWWTKKKYISLFLFKQTVLHDKYKNYLLCIICCIFAGIRFMQAWLEIQHLPAIYFTSVLC